jgi:hypothetical protein
LDIKDKLISLDEKLVIEFKQNEHSCSHFQEITDPGFQEWDVSIFGFQTACEAEKAGLKLAESLFWLSISRNYPIRFIYNKSLPCTVFDRTLGSSMQMYGYGHPEQTENQNDIVSCIKEVFTSEVEPIIDRERLLLAMELYSSSSLEITQQSKFITLITSLEELSEQQDYKKYISFVEVKITELKDAIESENEANIPEKVKNSLKGRIGKGLLRESVNQAVLRMMQQCSADTKEQKELFSLAYKTRSDLLHDGKTSEYLPELNPKTSEMIRNIFSNCLELKLKKNIAKAVGRNGLKKRFNHSQGRRPAGHRPCE